MFFGKDMIYLYKQVRRHKMNLKKLKNWVIERKTDVVACPISLTHFTFMANKIPNYGIYSPEHVKEYGASCAIILGCIIKWCNHNKKNDNHLYDGYYWSGHITHKEFAEQTGLELKTVQRSLKWLLDCKVIANGRYNKLSYDKTGWYRTTGHFVPKVQDKLIPTTVQNVHIDMDKMSVTIPVNPFQSIENLPINPILGEIEFIELNKEQIDNLKPEDRVEYFYKKNEYNKLNKKKINKYETNIQGRGEKL